MFKRMTLLKRLPEQTPEAFQTHWVEVHGKLVMKLPRIRRYVQNDIREAWPATDFNGIVELWFDDHAALADAFASPAGRALPDDEANFIGGKIVCDVEEHVVVPIRGAWAGKLISVVSLPDGDDDLWHRWREDMAAKVGDLNLVGLTIHRIAATQFVGSERPARSKPFGFVAYYLDGTKDVGEFALSLTLDAFERVPSPHPSSSTRILVSPRELCSRM